VKTNSKAVGGHVLREDAVVDGGQCVGAGEAKREDAEVTL